jgi:NADH-quinone oxidoreductase subunit E
MSMSKFPDKTMTKDNPFAALANDMTEMQKEAAEWMSGAALPQFAGMSNLAAHPMGAMVAASALGMGMASQFFGMMAGTMAGAMQAANMLANETTGGHSELYGVSNPLNFDIAAGSFDDTKEEDPVTHQPPVKAERPKKAPAPAKPKAKAKSAAPEAKAEMPKATFEMPEAAPGPVQAEPVAAEPVAMTASPTEEAPVATGKIEPIMPEDFVKPKAMDKPDMPDDLKAIAGIGPKLEQVLNSLGIWTYAQVADWTPYEVAWIDDYLQFKGRIERDDWIAQAAVLAEKK